MWSTGRRRQAGVAGGSRWRTISRCATVLAAVTESRVIQSSSSLNVLHGVPRTQTLSLTPAQQQQFNTWPKSFDVRPHRRRTRTVHTYSPGCAPRLIHGSLDPSDSASLSFAMGRHFHPKMPLRVQGSNTWFHVSILLGTPESICQTASRSVQTFLHGSRS